jgi:N-acetylglucosaminyldiphosphoundecaprenol N-acetyl-beta-D-mannosaminyltransferase
MRLPACDQATAVRRSGTVNGVRFDPVSKAELADRVSSFIHEGGSHIVRFCAAHPTVLARGNSEYRTLLNSGDLNVPDGAPVAWALRLEGIEAQRLPGSDAMEFLCHWGVSLGLRHYLFGGTPSVVAALQTRLETDIPGICIVGVESPPFRPLSETEWAAVAERVTLAEADLLWIGLGVPKQDAAAQILKDLNSAPVILCVGAAFDFLSGSKRRAPRWMRTLGLEWLHRLSADPRRLWRRYLLGNPQFVAGITSDYVRSRIGRKAPTLAE